MYMAGCIRLRIRIIKRIVDPGLAHHNKVTLSLRSPTFSQLTQHSGRALHASALPLPPRQQPAAKIQDPRIGRQQQQPAENPQHDPGLGHCPGPGDPHDPDPDLPVGAPQDPGPPNVDRAAGLHDGWGPLDPDPGGLGTWWSN